MRIAIMGSGAVGGYFGAFLARAGHDVGFIARGAHLSAIREHGLRLAGPRGDFNIRAPATDTPGELGTVDVVLFCVKLYDTEVAAAQIEPLLRDGGVCISLMNGVDGQERLAAVLGADRVMGGLAFVAGVIEAPGQIRYTSDMSSVVYGEADGSLSARAIGFRDACIASGFGAQVSPDIRTEQWKKFVGLATNAALTSLSRQPAGYVYRDPDMLEIAGATLQEAIAVAQAMNITLPPDTAPKLLGWMRNFPPGMYASMANDLLRGRRLELESFSGYLMRKGRELGVPTPIHTLAYACLKPYVNGPPVGEVAVAAAAVTAVPSR
ncbi:MAG: 2-dehydropantoate 2-reductase [Betaproteobacteria bacterium]|nr:2-dehydropantoate 2-reductase [Betaproteobacteria bacterium]